MFTSTHLHPSTHTSPLVQQRQPNTHLLDPRPEDEKPALPPLKGLSFLDRFLVIWIILAMGIGIALGNTVDSVGPALQRGEFVGVSIPIGGFLLSFITSSTG